MSSGGLKGEGATVSGMKHVTYAEKSLLVGSGAADLLIEYAALIGPMNRSDVMGYMLERIQDLKDPFPGVPDEEPLLH